MAQADQVRWRCRTTLRKYAADIDDYRARRGIAAGEREFERDQVPYEERVVEGNLLLQEGIEALWTLLIGGTATPYNSANALIGVGNSSTPAVDDQTGLQGASTAFKGMDSGYPQLGALADKSVIFRASFGSSEANFAWAEWTVDNGAAANKNLNRKVEDLGTKSSGTWQLTVEISLA